MLNKYYCAFFEPVLTIMEFKRTCKLLQEVFTKWV
jgi:hypothetical protein